MTKSLSKDEMLYLIQQLMAGRGSDQEATEWINLLTQNTQCPHLSDLIFYPNENLTSEQILEKALLYKPIITPTPL